jgi:hypothetical protein
VRQACVKLTAGQGGPIRVPDSRVAGALPLRDEPLPGGSLEERCEREKPPQIQAERYQQTPRSLPPSAVRRKRETPRQRVSYASGGPLRVRPCRVMAGWNYSRGRSAGSSGGLSIVLLLVMAAHNPKARSSALADATRRAALEAPSRRAWPRRPAHTLPTHRGTASLRGSWPDPSPVGRGEGSSRVSGFRNPPSRPVARRPSPIHLSAKFGSASQWRAHHGHEVLHGYAAVLARGCMSPPAKVLPTGAGGRSGTALGGRPPVDPLGAENDVGRADIG